jgi:hypothetical protein
MKQPSQRIAVGYKVGYKSSSYCRIATILIAQQYGGLIHNGLVQVPCTNREALAEDDLHTCIESEGIQRLHTSPTCCRRGRRTYALEMENLHLLRSSTSVPPGVLSLDDYSCVVSVAGLLQSLCISLCFHHLHVLSHGITSCSPRSSFLHQSGKSWKFTADILALLKDVSKHNLYRGRWLCE